MYTKLKNKEKALSDLNKAIEVGGQEYVTETKKDKDFDELRAYARISCALVFQSYKSRVQKKEDKLNQGIKEVE